MQNTSKLKLKKLQANVHHFQLVYDIAHEKQSERIASYIKKKLFSLTSRNVSNIIGQSNEAISIFFIGILLAAIV